MKKLPITLIYKCRRCGSETFRTEDLRKEGEQPWDYVAKLLRNSSMGWAADKLHMNHMCEGGVGLGVCDLTSFSSLDYPTEPATTISKLTVCDKNGEEIFECRNLRWVMVNQVKGGGVEYELQLLES